MRRHQGLKTPGRKHIGEASPLRLFAAVFYKFGELTSNSRSGKRQDSAV